jgi:hypothetical protein
MPLNDDSLFYYSIHARDVYGNWVSTGVREVYVIDNDLPVFGRSIASDTCSTGEEHFCAVQASDNIGIRNVMVEYSFEENELEYISLELADGYYRGSIPVPPDSIMDLVYRFIANDTSDNSVFTERVEIPTIDSIWPTIEPVANITVHEGRSVSIRIDAKDNINITEIEWIDAPLPTNWDTLEGDATKPGVYRIMVIVSDDAGHSSSREFYLTVLEEQNSGNLVITLVLAFIIVMELVVVGLYLYDRRLKKKKTETWYHFDSTYLDDRR